jgi:hypothetical protein
MPADLAQSVPLVATVEVEDLGPEREAGKNCCKLPEKMKSGRKLHQLQAVRKFLMSEKICYAKR